LTNVFLQTPTIAVSVVENWQQMRAIPSQNQLNKKFENDSFNLPQ